MWSNLFVVWDTTPAAAWAAAAVGEVGGDTAALIFRGGVPLVVEVVFDE